MIRDLIDSIIFIACLGLVGCHDANTPLKPGPSSRPINHGRESAVTKPQPDYISGRWYWPAILAPNVPPLKQVGTIRRLGDSVVGKVVWMLDQDYSAKISNGKTDGTNISFDATFVVKNDNGEEVKVKFTYSGAVKEPRGMGFWGSVTMTGTKNGAPVVKDGKPERIDYPWNAFRQTDP